MWSASLDPLDPLEAAARLRPLGGLVFLDSALTHGANGRYSYVAASPFAEFSATLRDTRLFGTRIGAGDATPFDTLDTLLSRYKIPSVESLPPFQGGAMGFLAFEAAHFLERLSRPADLTDDRVLVSLGLYDTVLAFDHEAGTTSLISTGFSRDLDRHAPETEREARARTRMDAFRTALAQLAAWESRTRHAEPLWRSTLDEAGYAAMVERVREFIRAGDVYQVNVARRLTAAMPEGFDPFAFYAALRAANPAPYAAYLERPDRILASSSPELFLRLRGEDVETRPIKGTARRSPDPALDRAAAEALLASDKDRAENVMIVDLLRNDLSRVCEADSVEVPTLCALERFAGVHHLVSSVTGRLQPDGTIGRLLAATFPGGSITGAPKIRAIDIITELEGRARGAYCGSVAALGFCGSADLSIAIRTVEFEDGQASFGVGGGVTILSDGRCEHAETQTKAARILAAFSADAGGSQE